MAHKELFALYVWIPSCRTIPQTRKTGRGRGLDDGWPLRSDRSFSFADQNGSEDRLKSVSGLFGIVTALERGTVP
jgi:hypothetical protein